MGKCKPSAVIRDFWLYIIRHYDGARYTVVATDPDDYQLQTAGGQHWQRVAIDELTDAQRDGLGLWRRVYECT